MTTHRDAPPEHARAGVSIEDAELDVDFMRGETIHTENSYKFTDKGIRSLLGEVGFGIRRRGKTVVLG